LAQALKKHQLNIPGPRAITGTSYICPYVVVADEAFAIKLYLVKPYLMQNLTTTQRVHNYHLSHAQRVVESSFGQLSQRFRVFGRPIPLTPAKVENIMMASSTLHNFLLRDKPSQRLHGR